MSQKFKISLLVVAAIVVLGLVGFFYQRNSVKPENREVANNVDAVAVLDPINGQVVGEKMVETNPFVVKVNPFEVYKNIFKQ
jgi:hypothetical protein